jgi:hypothetical protein
MKAEEKVAYPDVTLYLKIEGKYSVTLLKVK